MRRMLFFVVIVVEGFAVFFSRFMSCCCCNCSHITRMINVWWGTRKKQNKFCRQNWKCECVSICLRLFYVPLTTRWNIGTFDTWINLNLAEFVPQSGKKWDENKMIDKSVNCKVRNFQCVHIHTGRERERENEERHSSFMWCYESAHVLNAIILCRRLLLCEKRFGQANTMSRSAFSVLVLKELIGFYKMLLFFFSVVTDATFCFRNGIVHTLSARLCFFLVLERWSLWTYLVEELRWNECKQQNIAHTPKSAKKRKRKNERKIAELRFFFLVLMSIYLSVYYVNEACAFFYGFLRSYCAFRLKIWSEKKGWCTSIVFICYLLFRVKFLRIFPLEFSFFFHSHSISYAFIHSALFFMLSRSCFCACISYEVLTL